MCLFYFGLANVPWWQFEMLKLILYVGPLIISYQAEGLVSAGYVISFRVPYSVQ